VRRLAGARAQARAAAWEAGAGPDGEGATIDLDATIVRIRSDEEDAAPTHKRTYGHRPLSAIDGRVRDAFLLVQGEDWEPAREAGGGVSATAPRSLRSTGWSTCLARGHPPDRAP
jgi:hypothetical protein